MKSNLHLTPNETLNQISLFLKEIGYLKITFIIVIITISIITIILAINVSIRFINLPSKERTERLNELFSMEEPHLYKLISLSSEAMWQLISSFLYLNGKKDEETKKRKRENEKNNREINNYLEEEYVSAKKTRSVFINLFFISTVSMIVGFLWIKSIDLETRVIAGLLYFGLSLFVLFIIRACYSRTAVILSILEDQNKRNDLSLFFSKYKKNKDLNDNDIELIKELRTSRSERERTVKHPYEIILKNISQSNLEIDDKKIKVERKK